VKQNNVDGVIMTSIMILALRFLDKIINVWWSFSFSSQKSWNFNRN